MEELMGAIRRGQGARPAGQMKEWLRGYECDQETLNAEDSAQWLKVRKQEATAERRARLPGRCTGEGVRKVPMDRDRAIGRQMYRADYTKSTFHYGEGDAVTKDEVAEEMLWRTRESISKHSPRLPPGLKRY